jgi:hypothetical protein
MSEVQAHGNLFEEQIITNMTGLSKREYEQLIPNGYTSPLDIHKGVAGSLFDASVKVSKNGTDVACGDIIRFYNHVKSGEFKLIVGKFTQQGNKKVYEEIYEFEINPDTHKILFGDLDFQAVADFVSYVKAIPEGKEAQLANQAVWKSKRNDIIGRCSSKPLFKIDAKIDSKKQRRVQCSVKLKDLINSRISYKVYKVEYQGIALPYVQDSKTRTFNK